MLTYIGLQIRSTRKRLGLTQAQVAANLGMSRATISQIESGVIQEIGVRRLTRLLDLLGLELTVRPAGRPPTLEELQEEQA